MEMDTRAILFCIKSPRFAKPNGNGNFSSTGSASKSDNPVTQLMAESPKNVTNPWLDTAIGNSSSLVLVQYDRAVGFLFSL